MTYRIEGQRGFRATAESAAGALPKARSASLQFGPVRIFGPASELTLEELERLAEAERAARPPGKRR